MVRNGRQITLEIGDHAFMQGDNDSNVYFVKSGLLKAYYVRADGKEHIKSFLAEGSIIGSMVALVDGNPCTFSLVASEPTLAISLPYKVLADAAQNDISLANALVEFLSAYGKRKEQREYQLLSLSAEDRYAVMIETMPEIANRVSQAELAAYIGITPQALSRIKRRLSQ
ncbi:Crp/Fnr family transcriptional regulator [Parasphingorhabdus sp.]